MPDTAPPASQKRPLWKWALFASAGLVALVVILLLSLRFAAQSSFGRSFVEKRIEAAEPSGQSINVEDLKGDLLGRFSIGRLTVSDEDGIWLVAENLIADWKPFALRKRALLVEDLEADLIHVIRRPKLVSEPSTNENTGSMPIRTGDIERLVIREFRSDEAVLPRALSLSIEGNGKLRNDGGLTQLSVIPLEGDGDRLSADLRWSDDFRVTGALDLAGPAGGLFASLAQLESDQPITAKLEAAGTLDEWKADGEVQVARESTLVLSANASGEMITFSVDAHPGIYPPTRQLTNWLGDTVKLVGDLSREDGRLKLDLSANAERLTVSAQLDQGETGAWGADLRLVTDEPSRFIGQDNVFIQQAVIDGNLVYDAGTARFDGIVSASSVDAASFHAAQLSGPVTAIYTNSSVSIRSTLSAEQADLDGIAGQIAGAQPSLQANAEFDLSSNVLSLQEFIAKGAAGQFSAAGTATLSAIPSVNLAGNFQLDGAKAGLASPFKAAGQFELSNVAANTTRFSTRINASEFDSLPAPFDQWMGEQADLSATGQFIAGAQTELSALTIRSGTLNGRGSGTISVDGNVGASLDLTAGEGVIGGATISSIVGRANVDGTVDDLIFQVSFASPSLTSGNVQFNDARASANGRYASGDINADLSINAESSAGPLMATTGLSIAQGSWSLQGLTASWDTLKAAANFSGTGGDIASLRGEATIRGDLPPGLPAKNIELDASLSGEQLLLDATLGEVALGPTEADALVIRASGTPAIASFLVELDGRTKLNDLDYPTLLEIDGMLTGLASQTSIAVEATLNGSFGDIQLVTQEPLRYQNFEDGFTASTRLATLEGEIGADVTTRGTTSLSLQASDLKIAPLLLVAGRPPLDGALDLNLAFSETETGGLAGPMRAELLQVSRQDSDIPPVDLLVSGDLTPDLLKLSIRALDNQSLEADVSLDVPVMTSDAAPFITPNAVQEIPFSATANGQIEAISALFVPPQMVLTGRIDASLSGRLPTLDQSFAGNLALSDGVFEHGDLGMILNQINANVGLGNGRLTLSRFDARGRSGGTLSGQGAMGIDGSGESDLELTANQLVVTERREGRATVSGTMQLVQQPDLLEVVGDLTVDSGLINIEKIPSGGPPTLDVSFETPDEEETLPKSKPATRLDIKLSAPGRISVEGRGVNAELGLDADIEGTLGEPVVTGEARIVRGRFDLVGKRFTFGDSTVTLTQDVSKSQLDITATHETSDDITAVLNVTGTAERPEVELTSSPELPDDEVLSRVLFGRSPSQLTALETARLAAALAQLSGGGGFNLLGGLQQALGLDTFDVGADAAGSVEVTSGKYLTSNVYLEVRSGEAGAPGVAIEWEPIRNIEVEAATGSEDGQEFSIQWTRDFDDPS